MDKMDKSNTSTFYTNDVKDHRLLLFVCVCVCVLNSLSTSFENVITAVTLLIHIIHGHILKFHHVGGNMEGIETPGNSRESNRKLKIIQWRERMKTDRCVLCVWAGRGGTLLTDLLSEYLDGISWKELQVQMVMMEIWSKTHYILLICIQIKPCSVFFLLFHKHRFITLWKLYIIWHFGTRNCFDAKLTILIQFHKLGECKTVL